MLNVTLAGITEVLLKPLVRVISLLVALKLHLKLTLSVPLSPLHISVVLDGIMTWDGGVTLICIPYLKLLGKKVKM